MTASEGYAYGIATGAALVLALAALSALVARGVGVIRRRREDRRCAAALQAERKRRRALCDDDGPAAWFVPTTTGDWLVLRSSHPETDPGPEWEYVDHGVWVKHTGPRPPGEWRSGGSDAWQGWP